MATFQKNRTKRRYRVDTIFHAAALIVVTKSGFQIAGSSTDSSPTIDIHHGEIPNKPTGRIAIVLNLIQILSDAKLRLTKLGSE